MKIINELLKDKDNFHLLEHNEEENYYIFVDQATIRRFKVFPVNDEKAEFEWMI